MTLSYTGTNLTGLANPDGGLHTVVYDGSHHATSDQFGSLSTAYRYSTGVLSGYTPGDGGASALSPQDTFGLTTLVAAPAVRSLTDPLNRGTREQLDGSGRPLAVTAPDGGVTQYTRNSNGWVTKMTDPDGNVTSYTLDSAGYATQVTLPDGNTQQAVYQTAFHALTQTTDENGNLSTYTYDSGGHRLTQKDPLGDVTSYGYLTNGLMQTMTDALGRVSTYAYDTSRRLSTTTDAAGNAATVTYDGNGNQATAVGINWVHHHLRQRCPRPRAAPDGRGRRRDELRLQRFGPDQQHRPARVRHQRFVQHARLAGERSAGGGHGGAAVGAVQLRLRGAADGHVRCQRQLELQRLQRGGATTTSSTKPVGGVAASAFDLAGQPTLSTDVLGAATSSVYNSRGWVTPQCGCLGQRHHDGLRQGGQHAEHD